MDHSMEEQMAQMTEKIKQAAQSNDKATSMQQAIWEMLNDFELPIPDHVKEKMKENMPMPDMPSQAAQPQSAEPVEAPERSKREQSQQPQQAPQQPMVDLEPIKIELEEEQPEPMPTPAPVQNPTEEEAQQQEEQAQRVQEIDEEKTAPITDYQYQDEPAISLAWTNTGSKRKKRRKKRRKRRR